MFRNKSASSHQFAMIPRADIPRSSFNMQKTYKTTFDSGYLVPIFCEEVLPGDTFNCRMTAFARLATPLTPIMDNMYLESFFFFVPNRLVWDNWVKFMGEQTDPGDSIDYIVPTITSPASGYPITSLYDYFGLPTVGQIATGETFPHSALPLRGYNLIYNEWFRDENLVDHVFQTRSDGPDNQEDYVLLRRGKRHDYFTGCLPFLQKGPSATLPLGTTAPVIPDPDGDIPTWMLGAGNRENSNLTFTTVQSEVNWSNSLVNGGNARWDDPGLVTDLSAATAATINQIRLSFQVQKLLERDARGGTRYTEIIRSHFGVLSPDARLQRPEYIGGGSTSISVNPIAQTSATTTTPQGNLAAMGTALAQGHGFTQSFVEHGYVIGIINVRADLTYQQGLRRHWSRATRYDYYFPAFSMLGEQAVLNKEIYCRGLITPDNQVFGYQERWAEYRYDPSEITGYFRSTATNTIDQWHLSQRFTSLPALNEVFIADNPPVERILAVGEEALGQQFLLDAFFDIKAARPMPLYSVPGLIDHF